MGAIANQAGLRRADHGVRIDHGAAVGSQGLAAGALLAQWQTSTPWLLGAGYTYTQANRANGITDGARYRQFALQQAYWFTKRTSVYFLEAVQRASGQTLAANGRTVIDADAVIGTSQAGLVGDGAHQTMFSVGLRHSF